MRRRNPAKQELISGSARALFWRHGVRRVSVQEICREAGVSKVTFYKYYANKTELARRILDDVFSAALEQYRLIMKQPIPFPEKVRQTIMLKAEQSKTLGPDFFDELFRDADPAIRAHYTRLMERTKEEVMRDYLEAQKRDEIRSDIKPEFVLYILNRLIDMMRERELHRLYDSPSAVIMELTNFFFYGILPRSGAAKGSSDAAA